MKPEAPKTKLRKGGASELNRRFTPRPTALKPLAPSLTAHKLSSSEFQNISETKLIMDEFKDISEEKLNAVDIEMREGLIEAKRLIEEERRKTSEAYQRGEAICTCGVLLDPCHIHDVEIELSESEKTYLEEQKELHR
jgi:hypothetical protein